jgi:CRISPR-associated protein Csb2
MLVIELRFHGGRYHATPWGRNVVEGIPEWPPSPYRFLRALYDTWKRKQSAMPETRVEHLLGALAREPPLYHLPPANASHLRSYVSSNKPDRSSKQRILDAFVVLDPESRVLMGWPDLELSPEETKDLETLLGALNYLGRSESWVIGRISSGPPPANWNCRPSGHETGERVEGREEEVSVACAVPPRDFMPGQTPEPTTRRGFRAPPASWLDALSWSTAQVHEARMNVPPAMQLISYWRPSPPYGVRHTYHAPRVSSPVCGAEYALTSKVPPSVLATVEIAERVRSKLMGIHRRLTGSPDRVSPLFSGKGSGGRPAVGHRHASFLPMDKDGDGWLDHLLVVCRDSLDPVEQVALDQMGSLWQPDGKPDIVLTRLRFVHEADLGAESDRFVSATPFISPRHYRRGRGTFDEWIKAEVRRELSYRGIPEATEIMRVAALRTHRREVRWLEFRRSRRGDQARLGYGFQLKLSRPRNGPFSLGYGSHFGLGLFVPVPQTGEASKER